jgi:hypothetical protein
MGTIASTAPTRRTTLILVGCVLLTGTFVMSFRADCVFDAKQGLGDWVTWERYGSVAGALFFSAIGCFLVAGILSATRREVMHVIFISVALCGSWLGFLLLFERQARILAQCTV